VLFNRCRCKELIDFTIQFPIQDENVQTQVKTRPIYIQQLEVININDEDLLNEVSDYLRADVNIHKWIDDEIIDAEVACDFEDRLRRFWFNQQRRIQITENTLSEIRQGQLWLLDCKSRQESISNMVPPPSTIVGTYHLLADELSVGWHPKWDSIFKNKEEE